MLWEGEREKCERASGNLVSSPDNGNKPHTTTTLPRTRTRAGGTERTEGIRRPRPPPSARPSALLTILSAPLSLSLFEPRQAGTPAHRHSRLALAFYGPATPRPLHFVLFCAKTVPKRRPERGTDGRTEGGTDNSKVGERMDGRRTLFAEQKSRVIGDAELDPDFDMIERWRTNLGIGGGRVHRTTE